MAEEAKVNTEATKLTKRKATQGKVVKLHKYWKGIATTIPNKADRRHYLNMMLLATRIYNNRPVKLPKDASGGSDITE